MKTKVSRKRRRVCALILLLVSMPVICQALDIYESTTIQTGTYDTVNIYDSLDNPPVQTTVDIVGGDISYCNVYDTAKFNVSGGDISFLSVNDNAVATITNINYIAAIDLYDNSKIYFHNGDASLSIFIYDDAKLHIYGYNLEYDETPSPNWITGQWENGQGFKIYLRNIYSYNPDQVFLHEVPEPCSGLVLASLMFFAKLRRKKLARFN